MTHFRSTAAAALLAATLALTACAPGAAPGASTGGAEPPAQHDGGNPDLSQFEGESMTYVYFTDGAADESATRAAIERFEEESGATVELQIMPFADLTTSLQSRIASGDAPEAARVANWRPFAESVIDFTQYAGPEYRAQFHPDLVQTAIDGEAMLAIPSDVTINAPFVNVTAFEEAGVAVPEEWTWEEAVAAAREVQAANGMQFAIAIDKSGHRLSTILSNFGTTLIGEDGQTALDEEQTTAALEFFSGLTADDTVSRDFWLGSGSRYAGANDIFLAQQAAVYLSGPWQVGALTANAEFEWAAMPNPTQERGGGFPGGKYMVAFEGSANPALGAAFAEWMNSEEQQALIDAEAYWMPTRVDVIESGVDYPEHEEAMQVFIDEITETPADTYASWAAPGFTDAANALIEQSDLLIAGQQDVAQTVGALRDEVDEVVARTGG